MAALFLCLLGALRSAFRRRGDLILAWSRICRNVGVYNGSGSSSKYRFPSRNPSSASTRLRAICSIQGPPGLTAIPTISTFLLAMSMANRATEALELTFGQR